MRMAKATKADIDALQTFFNNLENAIDEDKSDEVIADYVRRCLRGAVGSGHHRVAMGCDILIDNCCDPALTYLDYKPELKKHIPATHTEEGERLFYIISYEHSTGGLLTFWRPGDAGYTTSVDRAGTYPESQVRASMDYYHRRDGSVVAVPVEELHQEGKYLINQTVDRSLLTVRKHYYRAKHGILVQEKKTTPQPSTSAPA